MRKILVSLLLLLFFTSLVKAGIFISEPKDKLITFNEVVMLRGASKELDILKVNGQKIKFEPDGSFSCGLVLKPGKNYVEVRALDKDKNHFVKKIRILRLKTYPDMEILYDGKKHWARNQVIYLSSLGFIEGYPDNYFFPGNPITRGEFATWIARIKGFKIPILTEDVFFDVPKEHWRAPYIKVVVDAGFLSGYTNETFGIDDPISRREAAQVTVVTEGLSVGEKIRSFFIDVPREEEGATPIYVAGEKGLVKGVYENIPVYDPDRALTRAEAAVLLARFARPINSIRYLFDFGRGFSEVNYCSLNVPPEVVYFWTEPGRIRRAERTTVRVRAQIASRERFLPISTVKVNLSEVGGVPDTKMFDDGTHGDEEKNDLIYSLNLSLEPKVSGAKVLIVTAVDQLGWEGKRQTSLLIVE
ncbi:MAG: S-layer homology domain-containing protein [Candidatus Margulisiibacteriota bacterium]